MIIPLLNITTLNVLVADPMVASLKAFVGIQLRNTFLVESALSKALKEFSTVI
jgi:hypothetical protein